MWGIVTAGIVIIVYIGYRISLQLRHRRKAGNVIRLPLNRGSKRYNNQQKCSQCRQKSSRLSFYADEAGKPIGVCDKCRPIMQRRGLLRL